MKNSIRYIVAASLSIAATNAIATEGFDFWGYFRAGVGTGADGQGESVNILLNFTQFFETRIEYRFQIFTAHSCDFLLPSYARLA